MYLIRGGEKSTPLTPAEQKFFKSISEAAGLTTASGFPLFSLSFFMFHKGLRSMHIIIEDGIIIIILAMLILDLRGISLIFSVCL